jgi:hypothetical protein
MLKRLILASIGVTAAWTMMLPRNTLREVINRTVVDRLATIRLQRSSGFHFPSQLFSNEI